MPAYDYRCLVCDEVTELRHRDGGTCQCGGALKRIFSPTGISFRGKGFYRNDSRGRTSTEA